MGTVQLKCVKARYPQHLALLKTLYILMVNQFNKHARHVISSEKVQEVAESHTKLAVLSTADKKLTILHELPLTTPGVVSR